MSLLSENAKKEISKKFDLPERKSKIATMIKQNDQLYCICRSTDSTSFMIACDGCEEWYHGHCIGITQIEAKSIKSYYCELCIESNPSLKIEYKKKQSTIIPSKEKTTAPKPEISLKPRNSTKSEVKRGRPPGAATLLKRRNSIEEPKSKTKKCGTCHGCMKKEDCNICDVCISYSLVGTRNRQLCLERHCVRSLPLSDIPFDDDMSIAMGRYSRNSTTSGEESWAPKKMKPVITKRGKKSVLKKVTSRRGKNAKIYSTETSETDESEDQIFKVKQCKGPGCVNESRMNSKYCSDDCGIKLASYRLYHILPPRLKEYTMTPTVAEIRNKEDLEDNRKKLISAKLELEILEGQRKSLDDHIARVQLMKVDPGHEDDEPDEDGLVHCITCGHEVIMKTSMRHMEKCYKKYESQTSFGSIYKTSVDGAPLFCDSFNPLSGTYCKRLAVLCPEHSKDPKIGDTEICGYKLVDSELNETGDICRMPKKRCNTHFAWEKLSRAILDMERVRQYLRLDDLFEQERQLKTAISNRGGVMGLLLNSCFDHELGELRMQMRR